MTIAGLGPHGERAAPPERVNLLPEDIAAARMVARRVAVALHTLDSDWTRLQISGMLGIFGDCGVVVTEVADCGFSAQRQVDELDRLIAAAPDAIVALPVANEQVVAAFRRVSAAGIRLVLLENVPTGLLPGSHYTSLVSSDSFGLGMMAAAGLAPHLAPGAVVGVLGFAADFFATNEREIAFTNWMQANRRDVRTHVRRFGSMDEAADLAQRMIEDHPDISGFFVVWDTPAHAVANRLDVAGKAPAMATVDLGEDVAIALAAGRPFVSVAAQQPLQQGVAAARTTILALLGRTVPAWIAVPGVSVTRNNVADSFQIIWRKPAPREVLRLLGLTT
ncbi:substrate-binding domain-containing protein [Tabrizicola sp.]|jgi:ribose transport system substrate-binding protein|uniref:substrate-binding domain-containing protein n=1 Tax=Tabrizicola sp. TaxID=2005166 RepID=UPI001A440316|nr:substrate-binding domain-containing protein [Tabrizicola sp.]MBL9062533.1 substrate-binding domain-containing protein [Tabrizicola sp.]